MILVAQQGVSAITVAWIAVAGTLLGSLIGATAGGVVDYILERNQTRKRAMVGARLVRLDLSVAAQKMKFAETDRTWVRHYDTAMIAWSKYEDALAHELDGESFKVISEAAIGLAWFDETFLGTLKDTDHFELNEKSVTQIEGLRKEITKAYNTLASLACEPTVDLLPSNDEPAEEASAGSA